MKNFWQKLPEPFFALAPMSDVTDAAFRQMVVKYSKSVGSPTSGSLEVGLHTPLVLFTEFVSADGLASNKGRSKLLRELYYTETERPIVAQIFGSQPANIETAVKLVKKLGFDGVDINMGCPNRAVEKQGAGATLIKNPKLAQEIILAAKKSGLPVSVKTRLGYNKIDYNWIKTILEAKPSAVTFHLRTRKEMSEAPVHWEEASKLAKLCHKAGVIMIANGDVKNVEEGQKLAEKYDVDGIMIGRGALGQPWLFADEAVRSRTSGLLVVRLRTAVEHSKLFWDLYKGSKNFAVMRKHFKAYVSGFKGATALRAKLMKTQNPDEVEKIIKEFLNQAR